jgi:hypothetical protein
LDTDPEADIDVLSAGFLAGCKSLDVRKIRHYYTLLQQSLSLAPAEFPENLQKTKERMKALSDPQALDMFEAGISFLLRQTTVE